MSKEYFNFRYKESYGSPLNVKFVIYSKDAWKACKKILIKSRKIVDLGIGGGTLVENVHKVTNGHIIGIDQSEIALKIIKKNYPFVETRCADVIQTELPNSAVDTVLSTMTIEHVDDVKMLKEVNRILESDGYFFVTSVVKKPWAIYFYKNDNGESVIEPSHLREYESVESFTNLLKESNFQIIFSCKSIIRFSCMDPILKVISHFLNISDILRYPIVDKIRLLTRIPIPGYYAVEVLCKKNN